LLKSLVSSSPLWYDNFVVNPRLARERTSCCSNNQCGMPLRAVRICDCLSRFKQLVKKLALAETLIHAMPIALYSGK
jgi:hypothetical protein